MLFAISQKEMFLTTFTSSSYFFNMLPTKENNACHHNRKYLRQCYYPQYRSTKHIAQNKGMLNQLPCTKSNNYLKYLAKEGLMGGLYKELVALYNHLANLQL